MRPPHHRLAAGLALLLGLVTAGCGGSPPPAGKPSALPVDVYADTGRSVALHVVPPAESGPAPAARAWLARVAKAPAQALDLPPAGAEPDTVGSTSEAPPALQVDEHLKPPILRERSPLAVPPRARGQVELDVRVDEQGRVTEARWAGGSAEAALVRAATACARAMRFYPAVRAGRPVPVWCRERFDFGATASEREP